MEASNSDRKRRNNVMRISRTIGALLFAILIAAAVIALSVMAKAQDGGATTPAGGKWTVARSEDKMTGKQQARFELPADNEDYSEESAKVLLFCSDGKLKLADFRPNMKMAGPNRPSWSGRPQMTVRVRIDGFHDNKNWNWVNGHFLSMDKETTRGMIGAQIFKVEFQTPRGSQIAEFSPAGLNLGDMKHACGLKPEKP